MRAPASAAPLRAPPSSASQRRNAATSSFGDTRRRQREIAARRIVFARERRHQAAIAQVLGNHRQPAERDTLPADGRLHDLVVDAKSQRAGGLQSRLPVRREPAAPVEPRRASFRVVEMQQHVIREIGRRAQRRRAVRNRGAGDRRHPLAEQPHCVLRRRRIGQIADGDVDVAPSKIDKAIVGGHVDLDLRVLRPERRKTRNDPQRCERHGRRQREPGRAVSPADPLGRVGQRVEHVGHFAVKSGTGGSERECAVPPLEQRRAERILERLDLPRQRRLRDKQFLRGQREREAPARRLETPEEIERRQPSQRFMHSLHACKTFRING